jgi:hypothetical protein
MTDADKVVYRSTHPDVLAHFESTASADAQNAWRKRVEALIAQLGFPGRRFATASGFEGRHVTGVAHPQDEDIPEGWRRDSKLPEAITPDRRRAAGKRIAKRLEDLPQPNPRKAMPGGMPDMAFGAAALMRPGVARYGDAVYVTWSGELDKTDAQHIDSAAWERVKLSEYYAAKEQQDAAVSS